MCPWVNLRERPGIERPFSLGGRPRNHPANSGFCRIRSAPSTCFRPVELFLSSLESRPCVRPSVRPGAVHVTVSARPSDVPTARELPGRPALRSCPETGFPFASGGEGSAEISFPEAGTCRPDVPCLGLRCARQQVAPHRGAGRAGSRHPFPHRPCVRGRV